MTAALRGCVALVAVFAAWGIAESEGDELFRKVRAKVLDAIRRAPRYTCVQTVDRMQYLPQYGALPPSCAAMIAARKQIFSPGFLVWRDRIRLDVAVLDGEETFSWAGANRFETTQVDELVPSGALGTGEFAAFLTSVFGGDADIVSFAGPSLFTFDMPLARSHFTYHSRGSPSRVTGYRGSFRADPETAELKRLTIVADQFPPDESTCRVEDAMDYRPVKIGNGEFLLPWVANLDVLYANGSESMNETRYAECREYAGDSTIRYGDDGEPPPPPAAAIPRRFARQAMSPGLHFRIALAAPIHSDTAAAGDSVDGLVLDEIRDPGLGVVAAANDLVHGRILQIEQFAGIDARWVLRIRFDALEHDGAEQPLTLRAEAGDVFTFRQTGKLDLDQTFRSDWYTR
jgi:hypothetical protein